MSQKESKRFVSPCRAPTNLMKEGAGSNTVLARVQGQVWSGEGGNGRGTPGKRVTGRGGGGTPKKKRGVSLWYRVGGGLNQNSAQRN